MALKTTIFENKIAPKSISINTPNLDLLSCFKQSANKVRFVSLLVFSFLSFQIGLAQFIGDYRSAGTGNWTTLASWQYFNGTDWVTPSGTAPQGYPGQFNGTNTITISSEHSITIITNLNTASMGNVIVNGSLRIDTPTPNEVRLNTPLLSLDGGTLFFVGSQLSLYLPLGSIIEIKNNGTIDGSSCSHNIDIYIGNTKYAVCRGTGSSTLVDFATLIAAGGTFNAVITTPVDNPTYTCAPSSIDIQGKYAGSYNSSANYLWTVRDPNNNLLSFSNSSGTLSGKDIPTPLTSFTPTIAGNYSLSLTISTTINNIEIFNTVSRTITIINPSSVGGTVNGGTTTCSGSTSGLLTLSDQTGSVIKWQSSVSPFSTWTDIPNTTSTYTSGVLTQTTQFRAVIQSGSCATANSNATIVTINPTNTWNGSVSTDWNNPSNWSCGVPTPNSDILIPFGITLYPTLSVEITLRNVEIQNGALLNVLNNGLTITGTLTLNGKINLQNESQLIQTEGSLLISDCTTGKIEIDQQGVADSYSYNYWGSPVNSTCAASSTSNNISSFLRDSSFPHNIKSFLYGSSAYYADSKSTPLNDGTPNLKLSTYWMYKFANKPAGDYNSWTHIGNTGQLLAGEGFTLKGSNSDFPNQNYTFVGKPNNGLIELTVDQGMQYLIGNPYPSAIDAREFIKDNILQYIGTDSTHIGRRSENIIDGNLYFWDHYGFSTHLLKSYQGGYAIYNLSGEVAFQRGGIPSPPGSSTPRQFIPVAQGFFVNGLTNSGKIQFKNNQRFYQKEANGISEFIRTSDKNSSKNQSSEIDLIKRIYLKFNSPSGFQRQILAAFIPKTTEGIDIGYDAINNEKFAEDMSWVNAENKFVIQAVPTFENRVLPLEVKVSIKGISTISIDLIENIPTETSILIKDNISGMLYNLKTAPFEINLSPGIYTNRFELVLQTQKTLAIDEENIVDNSINIHLNNTENTIFINNSNLFEIKEISIHNMLGQQLSSIKKGLEHQIVKIPLNAQNGVYIVNVTTDKGSVSKKIIKF